MSKRAVLVFSSLNSPDATDRAPQELITAELTKAGIPYVLRDFGSTDKSSVREEDCVGPTQLVYIPSWFGVMYEDTSRLVAWLPREYVEKMIVAFLPRDARRSGRKASKTVDLKVNNMMATSTNTIEELVAQLKQ